MKKGMILLVVGAFAFSLFVTGCPKPAPAPEDAKPEATSPVEDPAATTGAPAESARVDEAPVAATSATAPAETSVAEIKPVADVSFDYNSYILTEAAKEVLSSNAAAIKAKGQSVVIEGHCDERGTSEYNIALGERRAEAAKKYLAMSGVPESKIETKSYGEEKPFCTESSEDCWARNRRAHFVVK